MFKAVVNIMKDKHQSNAAQLEPLSCFNETDFINQKLRPYVAKNN